MARPQIVGGYPISDFVENQNLEAHQCGICSLVCKETVHLPCNHAFCRECIGRWVVIGHLTCPYCRANFNGHEDMKTVINDPVLSLQVNCNNLGCTWNGMLSERDYHKKQFCTKEDRKIACECCQFYGPVEMYRQHKCAELKGICPICYNLLAKLCITCEIQPENDVCKNAKQICNHQFHDHCLERWIRKRPSCPLCDGPIVTPQ